MPENREKKGHLNNGDSYPELSHFLFDSHQDALAALEELPGIAKIHTDKVQQFLALPFAGKVKEFSSILESHSDLWEQAMLVYYYGFILHSQDAIEENQQMTSEVSRLWSSLFKGSTALFKWLGTLSESELLQLKNGLTDHDLRFFFDKEMLYADYRLDDLTQENALVDRTAEVQKLAGNRATLFKKMTDLLGEQGTSYTQVRRETRHPDAKIRQAAYRRFYQLFDQIEPDSGKTYLELYFDIYKDVLLEYHDIYVQNRGYDSLLNYRNITNLLPDQAVNSLIEVVTSQQTTDLFERFFDLKGQFLGEAVTRDGIYAPSGHDKVISFERAIELIRVAFGRIAPEFVAVVEEMVTGGRIDYVEREGKITEDRNVYISPSQLNVIIMSYRQNMHSFGFLAHELGHTIHMSEIGRKHPRRLTYEVSEPVGEIASTMSELFAFDVLLEQPDLNWEERVSILVNRLSDIHKNVIRQTHSVVFENQALEAIQRGAGIDMLKELFLDSLRSQLGSRMKIDPQYGAEWSWWEHLFNEPFGNYKYGFGNLVALSLYAKFQNNELTSEGYRNLLQQSATTMPEELLQQVGIDITDPEFWQAGIDMIATWVDELEELLADK